MDSAGPSPAPPGALARLREVPWGALEGHVEALVAAVDEVLAGKAAERVLDRALRRLATPSDPARRAFAEAIYGVGLWRRRLSHHTQGDERGRPMLCALLADLAGVERAAASALCGCAVPPRRAPSRFELRHSLPDWLAELFVRELGDEAEAFCESLNVPGPVCLRANRLRVDRDELRALLAAEGIATRPTALAPDGLVVLTPRPNILGSPSHQQGLFEVQDEGSQLLGALLGATPGERVLDLCAGAGGKTLQLASMMRGRGLVVAHDVDLARLERLEARARRAGADGVRTVRATSSLEPFDRVLVDAPCSELGVLRRGPDVRFRLDPASFAPLPVLQAQLLAQGFSLVRSGGLLVYATCTLRREENEEVARSFERAQPAAVRQRPGEGWLAPELVASGYFKCLPHRHGTDAFFAAVYRRR